MSRRRCNRVFIGIVVAGLLIAGLLGWYRRSHGIRFDLPNEPGGAATTSPGSAVKVKPITDYPPPADAERSHLADNLNAPQADIHSDLRVVTDVLEAFRSNFPHDGNPVGDNAEITRALTGRNKLHLALIPGDHPAINTAGELCDRWGTPFFFHAESGTRMAVRSAGPDKRMWTADDIVLEP